MKTIAEDKYKYGKYTDIETQQNIAMEGKINF